MAINLLSSRLSAWKLKSMLPIEELAVQLRGSDTLSSVEEFHLHGMSGISQAKSVASPSGLWLFRQFQVDFFQVRCAAVLWPLHCSPAGSKRSSTNDMWKFSQTEVPASSPAPAPTRPVAAPSSTRIASDQSTIGKDMVVVGEITGCESLFIDGRVEGSIDLPSSHVTIGRNGQVTASITARDVVVLGKVCGNIAASNLVELRAQSSVTGDVTTARLNMEDGASFLGIIDIHKTEATLVSAEEQADIVVTAPRQVRMAPPAAGKIRMQPFPQSA